MTPGKSVNVCFICRELGAVILTLLGGRVNIVRIHSHVLPPTQQHMKLEQYIINYEKNIQKCAPKRDSLVYRRLCKCLFSFVTLLKKILLSCLAWTDDSPRCRQTHQRMKAILYIARKKGNKRENK